MTVCSIEGYDVAEDDAAAAIDGEEPFSADEKTFLESRATRKPLRDPYPWMRAKLAEAA